MTMPRRLTVFLCLCLSSSSLYALELIRVRSDPGWALFNNSVNAELDFLWSGNRTFALAFYYSDGWGNETSPDRVLSPGIRVDFNASGPLTSGWHPNLMLQSDLMSDRNGDFAAAVRFKARQSYRWVIDPVSVSLGLGVQARSGASTDYLACYLCPTYEFSLGWAL